MEGDGGGGLESMTSIQAPIDAEVGRKANERENKLRREVRKYIEAGRTFVHQVGLMSLCGHCLYSLCAFRAAYHGQQNPLIFRV
jgi:hypothetical protein